SGPCRHIVVEQVSRLAKKQRQRVVDAMRRTAGKLLSEEERARRVRHCLGACIKRVRGGNHGAAQVAPDVRMQIQEAAFNRERQDVRSATRNLLGKEDMIAFVSRE